MGISGHEDEPGCFGIDENSLSYFFRSKGSSSGGGLRGEIKGFTSRSRIRMLRKISGCWGNCFFITLTFGEIFPSPLESKKILRAWIKRINRCLGGGLFCWKIELQNRGAPHFHLLVWFGREVNETFFRFICKKSWVGLLFDRGLKGSNFEKAFFQYSCKVEKIKSEKGALAYCGKYLGKEGNGEKIGRFWGLEGNRGLIVRRYSKFGGDYSRLFNEEIEKIFSEVQFEIFNKTGFVWLEKWQVKRLLRYFLW